MYWFAFSILCYLKWKDGVVFIVFIAGLQNALVSATNPTCRTMHSTNIINSEKYNFKWEISGQLANEVVVSEPACLDNQDRLVTKVCEDGHWSQSNNCYKILTNSGVCPINAEVISDACVFEMPKRNFRTNFQKFDFVDHNHNDNFWMPLRRTVDFGPFEYIDVGKDYGQIWEISEDTDYKQYFANDCLLLDTDKSKLIPTNCDEAHPAIRELDKSTILYNCPTNCHNAGLLDSICYCRETTKTSNNLAKVNNLFQKELFVKIADGELCRIQAPEGSNPNSIFYINGSNWQYGDIETSCSIIMKKPLPLSATAMVLSFESTKKKLYLTVYEPENLIKIEGKHAIYCFTDASDKLKEDLDLEIILWPSDNNFETFTNAVPFSHSRLIFEIEMEKYMGNYWCEAFYLNMAKIISNQVIAYKRKKGNEYAMRLIFKNVCQLYPCNEKEKLYKIIVKSTLKGIFAFVNAEVRVMKIFAFDVTADTLDMLIHISTGKHDKVEYEYRKLTDRLETVSKKFEIVYLKSSEYCLPENSVCGKFPMRWPLTEIDRSVVSEDICFTEYQAPVIRTCVGNFLEGADWSEVIGECTNKLVPEISKFLHENYKDNLTLNDIKSIAETISNSTLNVLDVYYSGKILSKIKDNSDSTNFLDYVLSILETLMEVDDKVMKLSQDLLNVTDETIDVVEDYLSHLNYVLDTNQLYVSASSKFLVHLTNPFRSNVSGLLLYKHNNGTTLKDLTVVHLERNFTLNSINTTNLELAVYVPESVLERILNSSQNNVSGFVMSTTIFQNDKFFINTDYHSASYILNVDLPGYGSYLENPLPVLLRSKYLPVNNNGNICGFWDNGDQTKKKRGSWSNVGANYLGTFNELNLHFCSFVHLTNFALLIMSDKHVFDDDQDEIIVDLNYEYNNFNLNIITVVGTVISAIGICGIFLTASIAKKWRSKIGTKILMNLSGAILLESIALHLSEVKIIRDSQTGCKLLGMILHYCILSKFCWMLIYALLQYLRFVKVMGGIPNNLILKSVLFGWGVPLLFVSSVGFLNNPEIYASKSYELCYPRGLLLYLTVLLPIILILMANIGIFCKIMYEITHTKVKPSNSDVHHKLQLYLAVLLFFVLGIPWIFGILAELMSESLLKFLLFYVFCTMTTLQGFVLFLFYIVLNKETRNVWVSHCRKMRKKC